MNTFKKSLTVLLPAIILLVQVCSAQFNQTYVVYESPMLLTKTMMEQHAQLVQKLLNVTYAPQQKEKHFQLIKDYWIKNDYTGMQAITGNLEFYEQLKQLSPAELNATVYRIRSTLIISLIEDGKKREDSRWYLQNYYAAHPPLHQGDIPFLKETADALLDCEMFINQQLKGIKTAPLSYEQRQAAYKELANQWLGFDADKKKKIMQGTGQMALIFYRWNKMSSLEKIEVKLNYVGEKYLSAAEKKTYQNAMAQTNAQLQQLRGQQWGLIQNELNYMKQSTDIIMGRGIRWDPSRNRYVQDGGIVTEYW